MDCVVAVAAITGTVNVATAPVVLTLVGTTAVVPFITVKSAGTGVTVGALLNVTVTVPLTALTLAIVTTAVTVPSVFICSVATGAVAWFTAESVNASA